MKRIKVITVILGLVLYHTTSAQSAKDHFFLAKQSVTDGNYDDAVIHLKECERLLKGSNARVESLKVVCYVSISDWVNAGIAYNHYMDFVKPDDRNSEGYEEIVSLKKSIDDGVEMLQHEYEEEVQKKEEERLEAVADEERQFLSDLNRRKDAMESREVEKFQKLALTSRNRDILEFYKDNFGRIKSNDKVNEEIDKHKNPNRYLLQAVESGNTVEAEYLVGLGGNLNITNVAKDPLLHITVQKKDIAMLQKLVALKANLNIKNSLGETPIFLSIKEGFIRGFDFLLDNGSDIEIRTNGNNSILQYAIHFEQHRAVERLLKMGVDANSMWTIDGVKMSPLYYAVYTVKSIPITELILARKVNVNELCNGNWTALMAAAFDNNAELLKLLLNFGADANIQGPYGWTALHFAARKNNIDISRTLLSKGASKRIKDVYKRTPRRLAREHENKAVMKLL